ncbi:VOC family protein [Shimia ponticola]|uniref:VOC family protein n=1 Tax=Shimia ponticola TaxID=2582893 RepID=UPI0011BFBA6A|nr:VOC family protein [Shimia ponticola]
MDYETTDADAFGRSLRGIGLNLLVTDVKKSAVFLSDVFGMRAFQVTEDFAIVTLGQAVLQLHSDATYAKHPLLSVLPESPPRGAGAEFRLYGNDPDAACARAEAAGGTILEPATDKPHGLREAFILDRDGYCWCPSQELKG